MRTLAARTIELPWRFSPLDLKPTVDAPDDDFTAPTLDPKWTVVAGSNAAVNLLESGNVARYDLTTRQGSLLLQAGSDGTRNIYLRQDYTLPDGHSIVMALDLAVFVDMGSSSWGWGNNDQRVGVVLNTDDSDPEGVATSGVLYFMFDTNSGEASYKTFHVNTSSSTTAAGDVPWQFGTAYLRIARSGLVYRWFISFNGRSWSPLGSATMQAAPSNVWIYCRNGGAMGTPVPIHGVDWIRLGGNGLDPWPLIG